MRGKVFTERVAVDWQAGCFLWLNGIFYNNKRLKTELFHHVHLFELKIGFVSSRLEEQVWLIIHKLYSSGKNGRACLLFNVVATFFKYFRRKQLKLNIVFEQLLTADCQLHKLQIAREKNWK